MSERHQSENNQLRLLYFAGPGDVIGTFEHWRQGRDDPRQVGMTYSAQFFQLCADLGAECYTISNHAPARVLRDGPFTIMHRPIPFHARGGVLHHIGWSSFSARLAITALRIRADAAVVMLGSHLFPLRLLQWLGVPVIPAIMCVLWPRAGRGGWPQRLLRRLDRPVLAGGKGEIISMSQDITDQVAAVTAGRHRPIRRFWPTYRRHILKSIPVPPPAPPFRVLFAGRIEADKGVFTLLEAARQIRTAGLDHVEFHLCGDGSARRELEAAAAASGMERTFVCWGHCSQTEMEAQLASCHVVVVPTRSDMVEGYNQVVVEAVLAGRPVITSAVCPSLRDVAPAAMEVPPDDADAYAKAIIALASDPLLCARLRASCPSLQSQYYDLGRSFGAAVKAVLTACLPQLAPSPAGRDSVLTQPSEQPSTSHARAG